MYVLSPIFPPTYPSTHHHPPVSTHPLMHSSVSNSQEQAVPALVLDTGDPEMYVTLSLTSRGSQMQAVTPK